MGSKFGHDMSFGGNGVQNLRQQKGGGSGLDRRVRRIARTPNGASEIEGNVKHRNKTWRREEAVSPQVDGREGVSQSPASFGGSMKSFNDLVREVLAVSFAGYTAA